MSVLDVFSCFYLLVLLQPKHSRRVKSEPKKIFDQHGNPRTLQSDRGKKFYGEVKTFCENRKIEITKSRPYHPQSQGKVEQSHRSVRKKIAYDLIPQKQAGVNWSKNLKKYAKCSKNEKRKELGWRSAFEVYFGRNPTTAQLWKVD